MPPESTDLDAARLADEREALLAPGYSPRRHVARTLIIAGIIALGAAWLARGASGWDLALVPAFLALANVVEWSVHRGPMHHPARPRILYKNHTLVHHRAFLHDHMAIHRGADLGLIMMPWYTMLLIFASVSPIAVGLALWRGAGAAGLFYLVSVAYFLTYETTHLLYHLPDATLARAGLGGRLFRWLQAHHRHHHRPDRMAHVNFNVSFPFADAVFGTRERPAAGETAREAA
jgi:hypothetical protein